MANNSTLLMDRPNPYYRTAILFSLLSSLFLALTAIFAKLASAYVPVSVVLFARFFICFLSIIPFIAFSKKNLLKTKKPWQHLFRAIWGFSSLACFFYSLKFVLLANALILSYTIPLFVPILVWLWEGAKPSLRSLFYLVIGFLGVILIIHPQGQHFNIYLMVALASGFFGAIAMLAIRGLSKTESAFTIMFYYYLFSSLLALLWVIADIKSHANANHFILNHTTWLLLLGVGIMGAFYQLFLTYSLKLASAQIVTPYLYISVVLTFFVEWGLWHHTPSWASALGIALATLGAILSSRPKLHYKQIKKYG